MAAKKSKSGVKCKKVTVKGSSRRMCFKNGKIVSNKRRKG